MGKRWSDHCLTVGRSAKGLLRDAGLGGRRLSERHEPNPWVHVPDECLEVARIHRGDAADLGVHGLIDRPGIKYALGTYPTILPSRPNVAMKSGTSSVLIVPLPK